jgi:NADPH:quinone reductase-like Zn-dependent oxidoreductase
MKAIVWTRYGPPDVLKLQEVETPVPKDDEVRVRIRATTVTAGDCEVRALKLPLWLRLPMRAYAGVFRPVRLTILGQKFAGDVKSVGNTSPGSPPATVCSALPDLAWAVMRSSSAPGSVSWP